KELLEVIRDRIARDSIAKAEREAREAKRPRTLYLRQGERLAQLSVSPNGRYLLFTTALQAPAARQTIVPNYVTVSGYTEDLTVRTKVGDVLGSGRAGVMKLPSGEVTWLRLIPGDTTAIPSMVTSLGWNEAGTQALVLAE